MKKDNIGQLEVQAKKIRRLVFETIGKAGAGHTGGSLSWVEVGTVLYFHILKIDPKNPKWPERDRFILSKGHSSPTLYCCLAERGYFPQEKLDEFDRVNGMLQGHPCMLKTPGVDISTGSLGQGLSAGIGMALGGGDGIFGSMWSWAVGKYRKVRSGKQRCFPAFIRSTGLLPSLIITRSS